MQYQKHVSTSCMYLIPQNFVSVTIFDIVLIKDCIIHYPGTLFIGTKSTSIRDLLLPNRGRYGT
jgi:hypothetical protein